MFKKNPILKFLSSLQLAIPLILVLIVVLALATFLEAIYSTPVGVRYVYHAWWFKGLLILLGVNVLCSALSRFPWKKYQTGFVITHLGIILILLGALVTQQMGIQAQLALKEGQSGSIVQDTNPDFYIQLGNQPYSSYSASFFWRKPTPTHPILFPLKSGGEVLLNRFYFSARKKEIVVPASKSQKGFTAIHLELVSPFVKQKLWLFLNDASKSSENLGPAQVFFEPKRVWAQKPRSLLNQMAGNVLVITLGHHGELAYQISSHRIWGSLHKLQINQSYPMGWMGMKLKILQMSPQVVPKKVYVKVPWPQGRSPKSAIHYLVFQYPFEKSGWLGFQDQAILTLGKTKLGLAYGPAQSRLPFLLKLINFKVGYNPGTHTPASYASQVIMTDPSRGIQKRVKIYMNHPLHYRGYTVYQASYSPNGMGKYVSIFAIGKDPGTFLKYSGSLIMISGIILMFWFKKPEQDQGAVE